MAQFIEPGRYEARIINYGIGETKAGDPQAIIQFEFDDMDMHRHEITWYGNLVHEKAQPHTLKALLICGLKGNDPVIMAGGVESCALDMDTPVSIVVEKENRDGKTYTKVAWINRLGGAAFKNAITPEQARMKLAVLNLKGQVAQLRQETGMKEQSKPAARPTAQPMANQSFDDDIGF